jgi:hypothetical protein
MKRQPVAKNSEGFAISDNNDTEKVPFENNSSFSEGAERAMRHFEINKTSKNTRLFCDNNIRTSKYTIITFLPKNLIDQFSKLANIYFLLMMILQVIS